MNNTILEYFVSVLSTVDVAIGENHIHVASTNGFVVGETFKIYKTAEATEYGIITAIDSVALTISIAPETFISVHSTGATMCGWMEEIYVFHISFLASAFGRVGHTEIDIANPRNIKESTYSNYMRIRIKEKLSTMPMFFGRISAIEPNFDSQMGHGLRISADDAL